MRVLLADRILASKVGEHPPLRSLPYAGNIWAGSKRAPSLGSAGVATRASNAKLYQGETRPEFDRLRRAHTVKTRNMARCLGVRELKFTRHDFNRWPQFSPVAQGHGKVRRAKHSKRSAVSISKIQLQRTVTEQDRSHISRRSYEVPSTRREDRIGNVSRVNSMIPVCQRRRRKRGYPAAI